MAVIILFILSFNFYYFVINSNSHIRVTGNFVSNEYPFEEAGNDTGNSSHVPVLIMDFILLNSLLLLLFLFKIKLFTFNFNSLLKRITHRFVHQAYLKKIIHSVSDLRAPPALNF